MKKMILGNPRLARVTALILFSLFWAGCAEAGSTSPWKARQLTEPPLIPVTRVVESWRRVPWKGGILRMVHRWEKYLIARRTELGLQDSQMDRIESMLETHRKYLIRTGADLRILRMEIRRLLVEEKIDLPGVEEKVKAMDHLAAGRIMETVRTFEKILAVLTPEQQKKANAFFRKSLLRW
jgi:Spy/CpxP family protein refolding chaperone